MRSYAIGNTPLIELKNITAHVQKISKSAAATHLYQDEAGESQRQLQGAKGRNERLSAKAYGSIPRIAATSETTRAVASCCAKSGLSCIVVQECYDSRGRHRRSLKRRASASAWREVVQLTVGPELFYTVLRMLEDTKYFNASLYSRSA